jgi:hypothetical protein
MSTKTTLKRIALVAVSALGFGLMSVLPANAGALDAAADVVAVPSSSTIATSATVSTRIGIADFNAGDTMALSFTRAIGTGLTLGAATTFTWKVLEHSSGLTLNSYQGDSSAGPTATFPVAVATAGAQYVLLQISTVAAVAGNTLTVVSTDQTTATSNEYVLTVTAAGSTVTPPSVLGANDTPWRIDDAFVGETTTITSAANLAAMSAGSVVTSATNEVRIKATNDTVAKSGLGSYRYVEVTGSTIKNVAGAVVIDGVANTATRAIVLQSGDLDATTDAEVHVNATAAGTVTIKFYDRSIVAITGATFDTLLQTITYTVTAPGALSAQQSTSFINALHSSLTGVATSKPLGGMFTDCDLTIVGTQPCDYTILAPAALAGVGGAISAGGTAKAVIEVNLKDAAGAALVGTLPAVGATISGPGTLSIGASANSVLDGSTGRSLAATAAPASTFYINVFSDGTSGTSTISILVGGAVWTTKTMKFYTTPTTVTATQGLKVLKANTVSGCAAGTVLPDATTVTNALTQCDDSSVAATVAVKLVTTDANGIPVPFRSFKAVSSDATVLPGAATGATPSAAADYVGANWYTVGSTFGAASGTSATLTYTTALTATTDLSSAALKFTIGGAPVSASLAITTGTNVGSKGTMTISVKDASGNSTYDLDHSLALTTSTALTTALGQIGTANAIAVIDGKSTIDFFNPLVAGTVSVTGLISDALPIAGSFSVSNASTDAATDAANAATDAAAEATDAANAATDAANAAAEAADAATAAAQDAADAVAALSAQVATLIAGLKAQLTALTNLVIKIQKKVKA